MKESCDNDIGWSEMTAIRLVGPPSKFAAALSVRGERFQVYPRGETLRRAIFPQYLNFTILYGLLPAILICCYHEFRKMEQCGLLLACWKQKKGSIALRVTGTLYVLGGEIRRLISDQNYTDAEKGGMGSKFA